MCFKGANWASAVSSLQSKSGSWRKKAEFPNCSPPCMAWGAASVRNPVPQYVGVAGFENKAMQMFPFCLWNLCSACAPHFMANRDVGRETIRWAKNTWQECWKQIWRPGSACEESFLGIQTPQGLLAWRIASKWADPKSKPKLCILDFGLGCPRELPRQLAMVGQWSRARFRGRLSRNCKHGPKWTRRTRFGRFNFKHLRTREPKQRPQRRIWAQERVSNVDS